MAIERANVFENLSKRLLQQDRGLLFLSIYIYLNIIINFLSINHKEKG